MKLSDTLKNKKFVIQGTFIGMVFLGYAGVASAFTGGKTLDVSALAGYSDAQKAIIQQAFDIRTKADQEASQLLKDNGINEATLQKAIAGLKTQHKTAKKQTITTALENSDYAAFQTAIAKNPNAKLYTQAVFDQMVQAYKLKKAGNIAGAKQILTQINIKGDGLILGITGHTSTITKKTKVTTKKLKKTQ